MSRQTDPHAPTELRARELFDSSVESLDARTRARLSQARCAAVEAAAGSRRLAWRKWAPAASLASVALVALALWRVSETPSRGVDATAGPDAGVEPMEMLADQEGFELVENDLAFYEWADAIAAETGGGRG